MRGYALDCLSWPVSQRRLQKIRWSHLILGKRKWKWLFPEMSDCASESTCRIWWLCKCTNWRGILCTHVLSVENLMCLWFEVVSSVISSTVGCVCLLYLSSEVRASATCHFWEGMMNWLKITVSMRRLTETQAIRIFSECCLNASLMSFFSVF